MGISISRWRSGGVSRNNADFVELGGGCQMQLEMAFIDDTTILSSQESITRKMLSLMDEQIIWWWMKFKHQKSRSLSLRKVKVNQSIHLKVCGQRIPTLSEKPVKCLGGWFDESFSGKVLLLCREHSQWILTTGYGIFKVEYRISPKNDRSLRKKNIYSNIFFDNPSDISKNHYCFFNFLALYLDAFVINLFN